MNTNHTIESLIDLVQSYADDKNNKCKSVWRHIAQALRDGELVRVGWLLACMGDVFEAKTFYQDLCFITVED